jgi:uncharacterized membrane protein
MVRHHHNLLKEGTIVGVLGAVTVAAWYLFLDVGGGQPLRTPSLLGQIVLFRNFDPITDRIVTSAVIGYTIVHFLVFIGLGLLITKITYLAQNHPVFLFAGFMLFVVFEVFFTLFTYMFHAASQGLFPWTTTLTANSLAAIVMTIYIWRHNPALKRALQRHPLGE